MRRVLVEDGPKRLDRVVQRLELLGLELRELEAQARALALRRRHVDEAHEQPRRDRDRDPPRRRAPGAPSPPARRSARNRGSPRRARSRVPGRSACRPGRAPPRAASASAFAPSVAFSARYRRSFTTSASSPASAAQLRQLLERPGVRLVLREEIAQRGLGELAIADRALGELLRVAQELPLGRRGRLSRRARVRSV